MDQETELKLVEKAANDLGEHFDAVQIFVSRHDAGQEDGTININTGVGNWFARYGQVKNWCVKSEERTRKLVQEEED